VAEYEQLKEKAGATMVAAVENPAEPQTTRQQQGILRLRHVLRFAEPVSPLRITA
jgi:hypothetical protein